MATNRARKRRRRRDLIGRVKNHEQRESECNQVQHQFRHRGTEFHDGHVGITEVALFAAMNGLVRRVGKIQMCRVTVMMAAGLPVQMRTLGSTDIAVSVDMHMEAAQLQSDEAYAGGQHDWSR